jgi:hypothetical protein
MTRSREFRLGRRYFRVRVAGYPKVANVPWRSLALTLGRSSLSAKLQGNRRIRQVSASWGRQDDTLEWPWTERWAKDLTRRSGGVTSSAAGLGGHRPRRRWSHVGRI